MDWNNAENKYEKQNATKELVFDAAGNISGQQEFVNKFRVMTDAQLSYLSENKKASTQEEKQAAFDKRTRAYADLFYDTYQEGKEQQAAYLAEKMQIKEQLMKSERYDNSVTAEEVAGSIIAIQKSKDFSESEKEDMLRSYGFYESPQQIQQFVNEILADNFNNTDAERQKVEEEAKRQAELQRQAEEARIAEQKTAEERRNALEKVAAIKINGYAFDETALSDSQKSELNAVVEVLKKYYDVNVVIVGHTCKIGYKNINLKKGLKRAEAGKEYLTEKGISAERIFTESKGETSPLVEDNSNDNRKQNRRIEFFIQ
jgi:outer membrane protein OmpA-like peptidoglycan-associated protein